jgi:diaminopropionate ammonia-lyase
MLSFLNPRARRDAAYRGLFTPAEYAEVERFYASLPELSATPLRALRSLAAGLGIGALDVKDESSRFSLNAFKIVGVHYAVSRLPSAALSRGLVCATAGNHGRAVARAARDAGAPCRVYVSARGRDSTVAARVRAMQEDGASIVDVDGTYEDAVRLAAEDGRRTGATIVSDTSWPGYDEIPRTIMVAYTHIFHEASTQWERPPDVVIVQGGVGGLVCAAASWFAFTHGASRPFLIACEPEGAACLLESARAGELRTLPSEPVSIMAGLRCAQPSPAAWPAVRDGVDAFVAIPDALALEAMQHVAAGPSGACGLGALLALTRKATLEEIRAACHLSHSTRVLAIVTEAP